MVGKKLGQYRLTAKIGEGGMGVVYLVMDLIEGQPLNGMARSTKLTTEAVTHYGVQIADALAHAHDRQIVHRDLKSANIVIAHVGRVNVLDLGLARRLDRATVDAITRSYVSVERDRSVAGTLPYMAPEVLTGETASYQSHIWALGVLLYEAVTGELPLNGNTPYRLGAAILHELPRPPPSSVPPGLSAVIMRCLAKDLKDRVQRAGEIRSTLETIQTAAIVSPPRREERAGPLVFRGIQHPQVKNGDVLLLLGTNKGAFLARFRPDRNRWDLAGPYFHEHAKDLKITALMCARESSLKIPRDSSTVSLVRTVFGVFDGIWRSPSTDR